MFIRKKDKYFNHNGHPKAQAIQQKTYKINSQKNSLSEALICLAV